MKNKLTEQEIQNMQKKADIQNEKVLQNKLEALLDLERQGKKNSVLYRLIKNNCSYN